MKCQYCKQSEPFLTRDHIIPKSKGGTLHSVNVAHVCVRCNTAKGNLYPLDFIARIDKTLSRGFTSIAGFTRDQLVLIKTNLLNILKDRNFPELRESGVLNKPLPFQKGASSEERSHRKELRKQTVEIRSRVIPIDKKPVAILATKLEFTDYETAEPGHPVFEHDDDKYRIYVKKKRPITHDVIQTVEIRYYKSSLQKLINHL